MHAKGMSVWGQFWYLTVTTGRVADVRFPQHPTLLFDPHSPPSFLAWQIFVDASSIEFCPNWTTYLQHRDRILLGRSVKHGSGHTHCSPNQKSLNDSTLRSSAPNSTTGAQVMREVRTEVHLGCWVKHRCRSAVLKKLAFVQQLSVNHFYTAFS